MGFSCGILGLPNAGKSTLFNALTKAGVPAEKYPFTTIDPNRGAVVVPDERLDIFKKLLNPKEVIPTTLIFVDVAGLVKGAHKGEGLGNQFLSHLRELDLLIHVIRVFKEDDIPHSEGDIEPLRDLEIINLELIFSDLDILERRIEKLNRLLKLGEKKHYQELTVLEKIKEILNKGHFASELDFSEEERGYLKEVPLLTLKPVIYMANIKEGDRKELAELDNKIRELGSTLIVISAKLEEELDELTPEEESSFLEEIGYKRGLKDLIRKGYETLELITFYTCANEILQAWTVKSGTKAYGAAGKVHSQFATGFIKAEVISFNALWKEGSIGRAKELGFYRMEGRDYVIKDGDLIYFRFSEVSGRR